MMRRAWIAVALLLAGPVAALAQPVFAGHEIFPPAEFAARRARVIEKIGAGVAIVQGTTERPGEQAFRQNNQFFYLCGVAEPRAILLIDGRAGTATVFLQPRNERRELRAYGPGLYPGPEAAAVTGLDAVRARDEFAATRGGDRGGRPSDLHALPARGARRGVVDRPRRDVARDEGRRVGRPRLS